MKRLIAACLAAALSVGVAGGGAEDDLLNRALERVSAPAVRAHVEFLADDLLEGRETGKRGHELAARYVATQLSLLGLTPAGDGGTFFQQVPLVESRLREGTLAISGRSGTEALKLRDDFIMSGDPLRTQAEVEAPVVFAGFGVTAPRLDHDDYAGLDVKGKIVALVSNAPARFPSEQRAYHASRQRKAENAAEHGAVGLLVLRTPEEESRLPWARLLAFADGPASRWTRPDGTPEGVFPSLRASATLNAGAARRLFASSPVSLKAALARAERGAARFALGVTARLGSRSEHTRVRSPNVVGLLEGSDAALRGTYVVYSAHLDHVGLGPAENGDSIYNGAYDNALGSAIVLEVARVISALEKRPRRSLLFLFVTGEERGLLGSDYFASHPTLPAGALVANVNIDMPLVLFPLADVVAFGAENSTLDAPARAAATAVGLALSPDPMPAETIFVRSDQYSFVRKGVPAVMFAPGMRSADAAQDGPRIFGEFLRRHYHHASDDLVLPMDPASIVRFTKANVALGYAIAQSAEAPAWKPGNFFGDTFAPGGR